MKMMDQIKNKYSDEKNAFTQQRQKLWGENAERNLKLSSYYHKRLQAVYKLVIPESSSVLEIGCGKGDLLASVNPKTGVGVDYSEEMIEAARPKHSNLEFLVSDGLEMSIEVQKFDYIILSDLINDVWDVQSLLKQLKPFCTKETRLIFNFYSHLWQIPLKFAQRLGFALPNMIQNWLTVKDVTNLLELEEFQPLRSWQEIVFPLSIPGANFINKYLSKVIPFRWMAMTNFMLARLLIEEDSIELSTSVLVPARNEEGHIKEIIERIPEMGAGVQIIFVEGHSTDGTYEEIKRVIASNPDKDCLLIKQPGKGKGDAVRAGFSQATGDILMILDADMTVPPEELPRFYDAICKNKGEFINGVRLVYPMEEEAMRFFNLLGNKFFAGAFSWLLGQPIRDTLCGTKVISRQNYELLVSNREYFGDFDPFGDFDLLFGAVKQNLKIVEIPVRYRAREYGETNIDRWRHGLLLLKMVIFAAKKIKFV
jgi:ubiquinone/menaquinone biosynthesis C-methylase UbiE